MSAHGIFYHTNLMPLTGAQATFIQSVDCSTLQMRSVWISAHCSDVQAIIYGTARQT